MDINKYFQDLMLCQEEKAEKLRVASIPDKLIKFIWLNGDIRDEKKFESLSNDEIWFSHTKYLNDPYEFKGMVLDRKKLEMNGYSKNVIENYQTLFDFDDYGITCLSANSIEYLPMWAYYTNNYSGVCVEYEVLNKTCIHEVIYEPQRIKVASLIFQMKNAVKKAISSNQDKYAKIYAKIFLQNLFIKSKMWEHEKEYRMVYPIEEKEGVNVPVNNIGMRTRRIVVGINCSDENINRLNEISNSLGLGDVYKSRIHEEKYCLEIYR